MIDFGEKNIFLITLISVLKSIIDSKNSKNLNNSFKLNLIIPIEEKHILEKHIKSIVQNEINIIYFHDELKSVTKI